MQLLASALPCTEEFTRREPMQACIHVQCSALLLCQDSALAVLQPRMGLRMAIRASQNVQCTVGKDVKRKARRSR